MMIMSSSKEISMGDKTQGNKLINFFCFVSAQNFAAKHNQRHLTLTNLMKVIGHCMRETGFPAAFIHPGIKLHLTSFARQYMWK